MFVLDYVSGPSIAAMKAAGVVAACRYTGYYSGYNIDEVATQQGKCLTPGEAKALLAAGISPVSNWEWYATRPIDNGLGHRWTPQEAFNAGAWDAQMANRIHLACGGPSTRPIYFSVDTDVDGSQVADYFKGIASVIGKSRTGAYGSYRVLKYLFDMGLISWGWQTYAWSYGAWESRAHIQQYSNNMNLGGASVDYNRSIKSDFGQWRTKTMIDLSNPTVAGYFAPAQLGWNCKQTGKNVHGLILQFYQSYGDGLCGLTHLGLPLSNEIPLDSDGSVKQFFERGVVFFDRNQTYDQPPGAGQVYTAHLYGGPGEDPKVAELEAQLAAATQPQGIDPAKVNARLQEIGYASHNGDATIQQLVAQAIQ